MGVSGTATTVRRAKGALLVVQDIGQRERSAGPRAPCRAGRPGSGLPWPSPTSEALHSHDMLYLGRGLKAVADELAPLLKVGRLTEIHRVVLQRLPLHEQAVAARLLDRTPELQTDAALRTLKQRNRLLHPGLERLFQAGRDLELRNLQHHSAL